MTDVLKGIVGKSAFLVPWIFAALIAFGATGLFLLPLAPNVGVASSIAGWDTATKGLVLFATAVLVGFSLGAASTPLYRLLEGYIGPPEWWSAASERQKKIRADLQSQLDRVDRSTVQAALLYEKLDRFPVDERQMAPTRLGNATRAFETYGVDRYQLDSQLLWYELISVAPKKLQDELDNSRAGSDFFVAIIYLSAAYGLSALALFFLAVYHGLYMIGLGLWVQAVVATVAIPLISYELAVSSTTYWATTVRALVNVGRIKLAEQYGLDMPATIDKERRMWQALRTFLFYPYSSTSGTALNAYRVKSSPSVAPGRDIVGADQVDADSADDDASDGPDGNAGDGGSSS